MSKRASLQKKICLVGAFSAGKSSLIRRFSHSLFDERYLTTVGVRISKKMVATEQDSVTLMIWDIAGEDDYDSFNISFMRGASGYILVVDLSRPRTLEVALALEERLRYQYGSLPIAVAVNKTDLCSDDSLPEEGRRALERIGPVFYTSAKTGQNVETLFMSLAERMCSHSNQP